MYSGDNLQTHRDPAEDKALAVDGWMNERQTKTTQRNTQSCVPSHAAKDLKANILGLK